MRLINTLTLELEEYYDPPEYAILSHTWRDKEEVLYQDFVTNCGGSDKGYKKIEYLCEQARRDFTHYAWIDTVCIDKSSSAELSEAINSMFMWYQAARVCYVYLDDTDVTADIQKSRWISRGWTLQELIAPKTVVFYGKNWNFLGTKSSLIGDLVRWTRIDQIVLENSRLISHVSAAARMSWAARRCTTRTEDMAYCLLGIFEVNMPLLYGEGRKAFMRLQEAILRQSRDISILAWDRSGQDVPGIIFATHPVVFGQKPKIVNQQNLNDCELTSKGLVTRLRLLSRSETRWWGVLPSRFEFNLQGSIALPLQKFLTMDGTHEFFINSDDLAVIPYKQFQDVPSEMITVRGTSTNWQPESAASNFRNTCDLRANAIIRHGYEIVYTVPEKGFASWNRDSLTSEIFSEAEFVTRKFGFVHREHDEAFIVMLTIARLTPRVHDCEAFLSAKVKPKNVDVTTWFQQEDMYGIVPCSYNHWPRDVKNPPKFTTVDDIIWERVPFFQSLQKYRHLHLLSSKCFSVVTLAVERSWDTNGWTIVIEPGRHAD